MLAPSSNVHGEPSHVDFPKVIPPRMIRETLRPEAPRRTYCIPGSSVDVAFAIELDSLGLRACGRNKMLKA